MKILMVTPELAPFIKVGGLADVVGSLPIALAARGHDVRVACPLYGSIETDDSFEPVGGPITSFLGNRHLHGRALRAPFPNSTATAWFIEYHEFYARPEVYAGPWGDHQDNDRRFAYLCRSALDLCIQLQWIPDVVHCHDWPTGLAPVMLNTTDRHGPLARTASVMTIHNLQHQGYADRSLLDFAHLPPELFRPDNLESMGAVNSLKGGIYNATKLTTVSPTYAREIQTAEMGFGLDGILRFRAADLIGVLNGIDADAWNPATDRFLPEPFKADDLSGKAAAKRALQEQLELDPAPGTPLFGVVSRLYDQKGLDLLANIVPWLIQSMDIQIAILGSGDPVIEQAFSDAARRYPGRVGVYLGFNNALAHLIYGGSDFFLMPSRFEPCGLSQMYSMRYGTPPVVRSTGGLVDTVEQYREGTNRGTGFRFDEASPSALYYTIGWATSTYFDRPGELETLRRNGMNRDFSWNLSAKAYEDVYTWAVDARRPPEAKSAAPEST